MVYQHVMVEDLIEKLKTAYSRLLTKNQGDINKTDEQFINTTIHKKFKIKIKQSNSRSNSKLKPRLNMEKMNET